MKRSGKVSVNGTMMARQKFSGAVMPPHGDSDYYHHGIFVATTVHCLRQHAHAAWGYCNCGCIHLLNNHEQGRYLVPQSSECQTRKLCRHNTPLYCRHDQCMGKKRGRWDETAVIGRRYDLPKALYIAEKNLKSPTARIYQKLRTMWLILHVTSISWAWFVIL